ncbi:MAG: hypothetical protein IIT76_06150, partial [Prevotella sp.]|nr:hypothetical protein [Prevotella sp.]
AITRRCNLFATAKVRRLLPDSKKSGEIFPELLRQGGNETTKLAQGAKSCREKASRGDASRGDRYLSHRSHHTQVPVPVTNAYVRLSHHSPDWPRFLSEKKEKNLAVLQKKRIFAAKKKQTSH